jgi:hypothetical protein
MPLTGALDSSLLRLGPANVYFNSVHLGYMGDSLAVTIETNVTPLTGVQAGTSPLDKIVTGGRVHVSIPIKEISLGRMAGGILNAVLVGHAVSGRVDIKNRVGLSARSLAKELRIIRLIGSGEGFGESTLPQDIFVIPEASPAESQVALPFNLSQQEMVITFEAWMNDTTRIWGYFGDPAAT